MRQSSRSPRRPVISTSFHFRKDVGNSLGNHSVSAGVMNMAAKFFYQESTLVSVVAGERTSRYVRTKDVIMCELANNIAPASLLACELSGTVNVAASFNKLRGFVYTPYGRRSNSFFEAFQLGFNGEYLHPGNAMYLLGNGYRACNPAIMRFLSPDSISPFQVVNAYGYCGNDPINKADPSGHIEQRHLVKLRAKVKEVKSGIAKMDAYQKSVRLLDDKTRLKDAQALISTAKEGLQKSLVEAAPASDWLLRKLDNKKYQGQEDLISATIKGLNSTYRTGQINIDKSLEISGADWAANEAKININIERVMWSVRNPYEKFTW